jgi:hypothetical protein
MMKNTMLPKLSIRRRLLGTAFIATTLINLAIGAWAQPATTGKLGIDKAKRTKGDGHTLLLVPT